MCSLGNLLINISGDPAGCHVIIVDDLVQTGGTLLECAKVYMLHVHTINHRSIYNVSHGHGWSPNIKQWDFLLPPHTYIHDLYTQNTTRQIC